MTLFVALTVRVLANQARRNTSSQYTITLHQKFLYALIAQTSLPVIVVFCPLLSLFYLIPMGFHNQSGFWDKEKKN
uniref:G protein-coupled receptor n=1 Tax=Caenorhabditis tropicalis TaxID=1561998 RepID=A0A1I7TW01_9PELO